MSKLYSCTLNEAQKMKQKNNPHQAQKDSLYIQQDRISLRGDF